MKSYLSLAIAKSRTSSELSTSSEETEHKTSHKQIQEVRRLEADHKGWKEIHGFRGNMNWNSPREVVNELQQPMEPNTPPLPMSGKNIDYEDEPDVFHQKVKLLTALLLNSRCCCVYSGKDLATTKSYPSKRNRPGSSGTHQKKIIKLIKTPTLTHHSIKVLHDLGRVHYWVQQYHDDGLSQKCGYPQDKLNEIHGSNYDPSNPVVGEEGVLRADLFEELSAWEDTADFALCIGTSRGGGMRSDRVWRAVCHRSRLGTAIGGVVISTHRSSEDGAALKIYAKSDHVMEALLSQLQVHHLLPPEAHSFPQEILSQACYCNVIPDECRTEEENVFRLPYDSAGYLLETYRRQHHHHHHGRDHHRQQQYFRQQQLQQQQETQQFHSINNEDTTYMTLDLREGAQVVIRSGVHEGSIGEVVGRTPQGHYRFMFKTNKPAAAVTTRNVSASKSPRYRQFSRILSDSSMGSVASSGSSDDNNSDYSPDRRSKRYDRGITFEAMLGVWWLQSAARGGVPALPVTNLLRTSSPDQHSCSYSPSSCRPP